MEFLWYTNYSQRSLLTRVVRVEYVPFSSAILCFPLRLPSITFVAASSEVTFFKSDERANQVCFSLISASLLESRTLFLTT
jgi:hypothetical protein